jgi:hypothetical protein
VVGDTDQKEGKLKKPAVTKRRTKKPPYQVAFLFEMGGVDGTRTRKYQRRKDDQTSYSSHSLRILLHRLAIILFTDDDIADRSHLNSSLTTYIKQTAGGLYVWDFELRGQQLNVRVDGQLTFNT